MNLNWRLIPASVIIGAAMAVIFEGFEHVVDHGQQWLWNDVFHSDTTRWLVVPLAVGLGILFGLVVRWVRESRLIDPDTNLFEGAGDSTGKHSLTEVGKALGIGASSLLAGAPLGPEMPLTESSIALGKLTGSKLKVDKASGAILIVTSIGALMVAFLGSMWLALLPFLLIAKKNKALLKPALLPVLVGCLSAFGTLWLIDHETAGYGSIPVIPQADVSDYLGAIATALCVSVFAFLLLRLITRLYETSKQIYAAMPWYFSAGLFGLGIGLLYWVGGETVQFSGAEGSKALLSGAVQYGTWTLLGLAIVKLMVIAWAKASGYRGGLYFPSIYASVALGLFVASLASSLAGPGVTIGAIAAIFAALGFPKNNHPKPVQYIAAAVPALLFIIALLPAKLIPLAMVAMAGAVVGDIILTALDAKRPGILIARLAK